MSVEVLQERTHGGQPYSIVLALTGYGAYPILDGEAGLHVFEGAASEKSSQRHRVLVEVVAQPKAPAGLFPRPAIRAKL